MPKGFSVVLASGSPRRRELLEQAGVEFTVAESNADEALSAEELADPAQAAQTLAERKAASVVQRILGNDELLGNWMVVGADTMVVLDGAVFGKPHNVSEATGMLRKLSGRTHDVITGVSVWGVSAAMAPALEGQAPERRVSAGRKNFAETSHVTFRTLTDEEIAAYLREGESYDKAGAYAIQGAGARLVDRYDGDYDNIVGLPVARLLCEFPDLSPVAS